MPAAPRVKGIGKKVAYSILGVPPNIKAKRNKTQQRINEKLIYSETSRVR